MQYGAAANELWDRLASAALGGAALEPRQHAQLHAYLDLLLSANQTMNLTRIADRSVAEIQHIGDALTLLPHLPAGDIRIADVGAGGGVPGIPIAIAGARDARVTLIEATKKKAAFLRAAVEALELGNVAVIDQRAEEAGRSALRESFDVVVVRAVATMDWLAEWCLPLAKVGGKLLAMKGPRAMDELADAKKAIVRAGGGKEPIVHPVELPETHGHLIIEIRKIAHGDAALPRLPSIAKSKPLR